eukprot:SAG31_NODE_15431_length_755_cov_1.625000_1_plen_155_part_00
MGRRRRKWVAFCGLTDSQRQDFYAGVPGYHEDIEVDKEDMKKIKYTVAEEAHVHCAHTLRCDAIREAQKCTAKLLNSQQFELLTRETVRDCGNKSDLDFTAEALSALQAACEGYLLRLYSDANLCAIRSQRSSIRCGDVQMAHRLRSAWEQFFF